LLYHKYIAKRIFPFPLSQKKAFQEGCHKAFYLARTILVLQQIEHGIYPPIKQHAFTTHGRPRPGSKKLQNGEKLHKTRYNLYARTNLALGVKSVFLYELVAGAPFGRGYVFTLVYNLPHRGT
jgi:hypothetical protein